MFTLYVKTVGLSCNKLSCQVYLPFTGRINFPDARMEFIYILQFLLLQWNTSVHIELPYFVKAYVVLWPEPDCVPDF